jgi:hypothetical protein
MWVSGRENPTRACSWHAVSDPCQIPEPCHDHQRPHGCETIARNLILDGSRPTQTTATQNCHAGDRGFESRRSRPFHAVSRTSKARASARGWPSFWSDPARDRSAISPPKGAGEASSSSAVRSQMGATPPSDLRVAPSGSPGVLYGRSRGSRPTEKTLFVERIVHPCKFRAAYDIPSTGSRRTLRRFGTQPG